MVLLELFYVKPQLLHPLLVLPEPLITIVLALIRLIQALVELPLLDLLQLQLLVLLLDDSGVLGIEVAEVLDVVVGGSAGGWGMWHFVAWRALVVVVGGGLAARWVL